MRARIQSNCIKHSRNISFELAFALKMQKLDGRKIIRREQEENFIGRKNIYLFEIFNGNYLTEINEYFQFLHFIPIAYTQ